MGISVEKSSEMSIVEFHRWQENLLQIVGPQVELAHEGAGFESPLIAYWDKRIKLTYDQAIKILVNYLRESGYLAEDLEVSEEEFKKKLPSVIVGALIDKKIGLIILMIRNEDATCLLKKEYLVGCNEWRDRDAYILQSGSNSERSVYIGRFETTVRVVFRENVIRIKATQASVLGIKKFVDTATRMKKCKKNLALIQGGDLSCKKNNGYLEACFYAILPTELQVTQRNVPSAASFIEKC